MAFATNVFINCPFDKEYDPLLKSLIFVLVYLGFTPKISQTRSSSNIRINQIIAHIRDSKFGIHDLSRSKPMAVGELPRFNMPYELGLDIGCLEFGSGKLKTKKILILETSRFHYQKVLSDIAGQDISEHNDDPKKLVTRVRNWFASVENKNYPGSTEIWLAYNRFRSYLNEYLGRKKYTMEDIDEIPIDEFLGFSKRWLGSHKTENTF